MQRLENEGSVAAAGQKLSGPFLYKPTSSQSVQSTPSSSVESTPQPSTKSTPLTSPESASPTSAKSAPPTSSESPLSSVKSTPTALFTSAPQTINFAPLKDSPTIQDISEPVTSQSALNKLDDDEPSLRDPEAEPTSTLDNILATLRTFGKYGILAPKQQSRDSKVRVSNVLKLIQSLCAGESENDKQVIKRRLTSSDYEQLVIRIAKDKPLQEYFNEKLRYFQSLSMIKNLGLID